VRGCETENGETFVSLPALFRLKESAPNGVVLKNTTPKTVLLTPKIDIDLEIPDENIHLLPESFSGQFRYFRGACFNGQNVILILDPEKLLT
jgi:chemotaxis signal transduction protein